MLLSSLLGMTSESNALVVNIPELVGTEVNETLKSDLAEQNIVLSITYVNDDNHLKGHVVAQDPAPGQTRKLADAGRNVTVNVQVSLGKRSFTLADLSNQEYREVQIFLSNMGAKVQVQHRFDFSVINGYIISTHPAAGSTVSNGDTVILYVSKGVEIIYSNMIDVQNKELSEARRMLLSANFIVGDVTREHSDTVPEGSVIRQSIAPGASTAQKNTPVDLVVSLGPAA